LRKIYPTMRTLARPMGRVQDSICISANRMIFDITVNEQNSPVVNFSLHPFVVPSDMKETEYKSVRSFSVSPIHLTIVPVRTNLDFDHPLIMSFLEPFTHHQALDFMWRVGNAIRHENPSPCFMVLFGNGAGGRASRPSPRGWPCSFP
jgi:P pilus assembly chaperone PapD